MNTKDKKITFAKRSFDFSIRIIRLTQTLPQARSYWVIIDQLIRSSTSIGANIAEAKSASSKKDYINFYTYALKSANETIYWLNLVKELQKMPFEEINSLINEVQQLASILGASIVTMKNNRS